MKNTYIVDPRALVREQRFKHSINRNDLGLLYEQRQDIRDVIEAQEAALALCESPEWQCIIEKFIPADRRRVHVEREQIQANDPDYVRKHREFDGKLKYISELTERIGNVKSALSDAQMKESTLLDRIAKQQNAKE